MTRHLLDLVLHTWPTRDHFREAIFREYAMPHAFTITPTDSPVPGNVRLVCRGGGDTITFDYAADEFATEEDVHTWALLALDEHIGQMEQADWDSAP